MSTFSRVYPLAVGSYKPGDNPAIKGRCKVTAASADIEIGDPAFSAAASGWIVTIYSTQGTDTSVIGSYSINSVNAGPPQTFTLDEVDGSPWVAPAGSSGYYEYILFEPTHPSSNDYVPDAIMFNTLPGVGAGSELEVILKSGQYASLPGDIFVVGAIYTIAIAEIIADGGATGFLLGRDGANGLSYISV